MFFLREIEEAVGGQQTIANGFTLTLDMIFKALIYYIGKHFIHYSFNIWTFDFPVSLYSVLSHKEEHIA